MKGEGTFFDVWGDDDWRSDDEECLETHRKWRRFKVVFESAWAQVDTDSTGRIRSRFLLMTFLQTLLDNADLSEMETFFVLRLRKIFVQRFKTSIPKTKTTAATIAGTIAARNAKKQATGEFEVDDPDDDDWSMTLREVSLLLFDVELYASHRSGTLL